MMLHCNLFILKEYISPKQQLLYCVCICLITTLLSFVFSIKPAYSDLLLLENRLQQTQDKLTYLQKKIDHYKRNKNKQQLEQLNALLSKHAYLNDKNEYSSTILAKIANHHLRLNQFQLTYQEEKENTITLHWKLETHANYLNIRHFLQEMMTIDSQIYQFSDWSIKRNENDLTFSTTLTLYRVK